MKFVKVTALAAALSATAIANAEMAALDDDALEAVTGQAGITIEQELAAIDVWYFDGDGATVGSAAATGGGAIKIGGLETVAVSSAGSVATGTTTLKMDIDVVDATPSSAVGGGAIRIQQTLQTSSGASFSGALKIAEIKVGGASGTAQDDANFGTAFVDANTNAASIGSVYVTGLDTTMYIYGH